MGRGGGDQADWDNHADQLNPNNDEYWGSRGWDDRPDDWEDRAESDDTEPPGDDGEDSAGG